MGGYAWVTLATNDSYSLGALVLAHSLRQVGTTHQLAVLITPGVTTAMREKLSSVFNVVQEVNILDSKDQANLRLLQRPELGVTFTKLHCWRLTQFDKCVFLDADTLILENADELFDREEFSAAPDVGWPDCFNSGVFVYRPSNETYEKLIQFALEKGSFDGGDQGLLNLYFSDWAHKDISKHLPFIYNMCSTASYSYLPAFKQFGENVKIVHFIGAAKPWLQYFDTESRQVHPSPGLQHLQAVLQRWWDIFFSLIQPDLTTEMARSKSPAVHIFPSYPVHHPYHEHFSQHDSHVFNKETLLAEENLLSEQDRYRIDWDPWDEYEAKTENPCEHAVASSSQNNDNYNSEIILDTSTTNKPFESHNTNAHCVDTQNFTSTECQTNSNCGQSEINNEMYPSHTNNFAHDNTDVHQKSLEPNCDHSSEQNQFFHTNSSTVPDNPEVHNTPYIQNPALPLEFEAPCIVTSESTIHINDTEGNDSDADAGLAAAFSQLKLGEPRSPGQQAYEDHLRRQGWEVGNIDYLGQDSFDNIWKKICQTMDFEPPLEQTVPRELTPPSEPSTIKKTSVPEKNFPATGEDTKNIVTETEVPIEARELSVSQTEPPTVVAEVVPVTAGPEPVVKEDTPAPKTPIIAGDSKEAVNVQKAEPEVALQPVLPKEEASVQIKPAVIDQTDSSQAPSAPVDAPRPEVKSPVTEQIVPPVASAGVDVSPSITSKGPVSSEPPKSDVPAATSTQPDVPKTEPTESVSAPVKAASVVTESQITVPAVEKPQDIGIPPVGPPKPSQEEPPLQQPAAEPLPATCSKPVVPEPQQKSEITDVQKPTVPTSAEPVVPEPQQISDSVDAQKPAPPTPATPEVPSATPVVQEVKQEPPKPQSTLATPEAPSAASVSQEVKQEPPKPQPAPAIPEVPSTTPVAQVKQEQPKSQPAPATPEAPVAQEVKQEPPKPQPAPATPEAPSAAPVAQEVKQEPRKPAPAIPEVPSTTPVAQVKQEPPKSQPAPATPEVPSTTPAAGAPSAGQVPTPPPRKGSGGTKKASKGKK